jgi:predicted lipoprotein with Yx(FWY)xxD motif
VRRFLILLAALTATAMLVAACDDDGGGGTETVDTDAPETDLGDNTGTAGSGTPPVEEGGATVSLGDSGFLVDARGYTLYLFDVDEGTTSACTDACADLWPPYTIEGEPIAGEGVDGTLLNTAEQPDGSVQVTYDGNLLYTYASDTAPGDTNGDGVGGVWHAVEPSGNAA